MTPVAPSITDILDELPNADNPGRESKLTGPPPELAQRVAERILEGGRERLLELIGMIRHANGGGEKNYKPGYALHLVALQVGAPGKEKERRLFSSTLCEQLGGTTPSKDVQGFLVRELQVAGDREAVKDLGRYLADDDLYDYVVQALTAMGKDGVAPLRAALDGARGKRLLLIVEALGTLEDKSSVAGLRKVLDNPDGQVRIAAARALAEVADAESAGALLKAADSASGWERTKVTRACLVLAEKLAAGGNVRQARRIYTHLRDTRTARGEDHIREAAERGLALTA